MVDVAISVVDDGDGKPIVGAEIWLLTGGDAELYALAIEKPKAFITKPIEAFGSRFLSGRDGSVQVPSYFDAGGSFEIKEGKLCQVGFWWLGGRIEARRSGYEVFVAELKDLAPVHEYDLSIHRVALTIKLKKLANQPPLQTPTSGPPAAGAPVAPPSGAAGR